MAGTIIQTNTTIADNSIINTGALIDHDCQIGSHIHIAPGTKISGSVNIQKEHMSEQVQRLFKAFI